MSKWFTKYNEILSNYEKNNSDVQNKVEIFKKSIIKSIHGLEIVSKDELLKIINSILFDSFKENYNLIIKEDTRYPSISFVVELSNDNNLEFEISEGYRNRDIDIHYVNSTSNFILYNEEILKFDKKMFDYINKEIVAIAISILNTDKLQGRFDSSYKSFELNMLKDKTYSNNYDNLFKCYIPSYNLSKKKIQSKSIYDKLIKYKQLYDALNNYDGYINNNRKFVDFFNDLNTDYNCEEIKYNWNEYYI